MGKIHALIADAYISAYNLGKKKNYGKVSIYDAGGDLSARWYVHFTFRHPVTGKMVKQTPIYTGLHEHKNLRDRRRAVQILRATIEQILENGYNPYQDEAKELSPVQQIKYISQGIDFALNIAKSLQSKTAYPDFKSRVKQFQKWLIETERGNNTISEITDVIIIDYLNVVLQRSSASNRNNTRTAISQLYKIFKDNKIVSVNIVDDINVIKGVKPEKNKSFSTDQEEKILDLLAKEDPWLYLYVGFISINLLRPIEVNRLTIADIDIKDQVLKVKAKNQKSKTKIIPELLLKEIPDLSKYDSTDFLFTPYGPGKWDAEETSRRDSFSKRFKEVVKDKLGLGRQYGLYSFRHTYITKLYRELRKLYPPFETKSRLMHITGHSTMKALEAYLREIDAELPEDYSHLLAKK